MVLAPRAHPTPNKQLPQVNWIPSRSPYRHKASHFRTTNLTISLNTSSGSQGGNIQDVTVPCDPRMLIECRREQCFSKHLDRAQFEYPYHNHVRPYVTVHQMNTQKVDNLPRLTLQWAVDLLNTSSLPGMLYNAFVN
jgi:hypothetical protein